MNFKTVKKLKIACLAPARFWSESARFWSVPARLVGSGGFMLYQVRNILVSKYLDTIYRYLQQ